jgi:hypothetical protein
LGENEKKRTTTAKANIKIEKKFQHRK